jgi:uncharacterized protein (DUF1810 family)
MEDTFNIERFTDAQFSTYATALHEIKKGRKTTHWMWFVFPQYKGLGRSATSVEYAVKSKQEAIAYLNHPTLRKRLLEITNVLLALKHKSAYDVFGEPDDLKLKSSMTLFDTVQSENSVFDEVLEKYFGGERCRNTLNVLTLDS